MKSPKLIVKQMVEKAIMHRCLYSRDHEVGHYVNSLSSEEREVLKELKHDDIKSEVPYLPK